MSTRAAAVAGYFYAANPEQLKHDVSRLLDAQDVAFDTLPEALIVPHAGYVYSGPTAACAYKCLAHEPMPVQRVLLIGPAHRVAVDAMAIPSVDAFSTPLGDVPLNRAALEEIQSLPGVCIQDEAHRQEHSLEVQLPFLQLLLNNFTVIPVLVGSAAAPAAVATIIDTLAGSANTLVVISSDLSHFLDYATARELDNNTCERILQKETTLRGEQACGAAAINGLMASNWCQQKRVSLLQACNSGDTAGSRDRVVGYAAFALH